jgi:hypothetical protein
MTIFRYNTDPCTLHSRNSTLYCISLVTVLIAGYIIYCPTNNRPKVVVQWSILLLNIREVPGSNFGPDIGYSNVFRGLPQSLQTYARILPQIRP